MGLFFFTVFTMVLIATPAKAWGPGTHMYLGQQVLTMGLIGGSIGTMIANHREAFLYGNVIADLVIGKNMIEQEEHSHSWNVAERVRERAESHEDRAFAMGFWMHLAADTVAHNIFVPRKVLTTASTSKFGHAYWEFRAEHLISDETWDELESLINRDFSRQEEQLESSIHKTPLPFTLNWLYIKGIVRLSTVKQWRRVIKLIDRYSRYELTEQEMSVYYDLSLQRMEDSVSEKPARHHILDLDPTGGDMIQSMCSTRQELQRMIAAGLVDESIYDEFTDELFPDLE
ncbi:MAG: zinc dependent phospholipase C family protein [bacterium]